MPSPILNPFICGKPVPPNRFVGRTDAVRRIFSRINNSEGTAIVGEPHIGKSSLLGYVSDESIRKNWLRHMAGNCLFVPIDCHFLPSEYLPPDFWRDVLSEAEIYVTEQSIKRQFENIKQNNYSSVMLKSFFRFLARKGLQIVLFFDEFDVLFHHHQLNNPEFFGSLRSLSTTNALSVVTASRMRVSEMNLISQKMNPYGSPFFNLNIEVSLLPLELSEITQLFEQALGETGIVFDQNDLEFINHMAGRHPYSVQMAASALFEAITEGKTGEDRYSAAGQILHNEIGAHFYDLWRYLDKRAQTVVVILGLAELKGRNDGRVFDVDEIENLKWYEPELNRLTDLGLVERDEGQEWSVKFWNYVLWSGRRWQITAWSFVLWLSENVITGTRQVVDFDQWLNDQEHDGLLTRGQKKKLEEITEVVAKGAVSSPGKLLLGYLKGWLV